MRRHWAGLAERIDVDWADVADHAPLTRIKQPFHTLGDGVLTQRERQIVGGSGRSKVGNGAMGPPDLVAMPDHTPAAGSGTDRG